MHSEIDGQLKLHKDIGSVYQLAATNPYYKRQPLERIHSLFYPPISKRQALLYLNDQGDPVGFITWAMINADVERRLMLLPDYILAENEWNTGNIMWITSFHIDSKFFPQFLSYIKQQLSDKADIIRSVRRNEQGSVIKVTTWKGRKTKPTISETSLGSTIKNLIKPINELQFSENNSDIDLDALGNAIGDARLVVLGQQTHGEANIFTLKSRIVRYLHEHKGFRVLAIESGAFDVESINEAVDNGKDYPEAVKGGLFFMLSRAAELRPLFQYFDSQRKKPNGLRIAGFDTQHTGKYSLNNLCTYLKQYMDNHSSLCSTNDWPRFCNLAQQTMLMNRQTPTIQDCEFYFQMLQLLRNELLTHPEPQSGSLVKSPGFWLHVLVGLENQSVRFWNLSSENGELIRELQMAQYLNWLSHHQFKDEKIIVWTHNLHALRSPDINRMGGHLATSFKDRMVSIGFTGSNGSYIDWVSGNKTSIHSPFSNSLENEFPKQSTSLLDLRAKEMQPYLPDIIHWRMMNYIAAGIPIENSFDLLIHSDAVSPTEQINN